MDRSDTIYTALILDPRFKTKLLLKELEDKESETGKRRGLGEDSALGKLNVGLEELDLSRLIGGQSFTVSSHIARKDLSIVASSLTDTGANGYLFIDARLAENLFKSLSIPKFKLQKPSKTRGFDGKPGEPITHAVILDLWVDGRLFTDQPFMLVQLGQYDMIIGRKWLAKHDVWLDVRNRRLVWPNERPVHDQGPSFKRHGAPTLRCPSAPAIGGDFVPTDGGGTVLGLTRKRHSNAKPMHTKRSLSSVDIAAIGAAPFKRHIRAKDSETFVTSLLEIDRVVYDKRAAIRKEEELTEEELIHKRLPECYRDYADVFSKRASDELPPRRENDYKIVLEEGQRPEEIIGYSPLYKQSLEELEASRDYIVDNLSKGFIGPSAAPFASPILMVRKPGGGLRFCVDYRRLNSVTRKDRYPLPLVDELMERLGNAKIFTKLDIRQGFHRIQVDPASRELTTFRTRMGCFNTTFFLSDLPMDLPLSRDLSMKF